MRKPPALNGLNRNVHAVFVRIAKNSPAPGDSLVSLLTPSVAAKTPCNAEPPGSIPVEPPVGYNENAVTVTMPRYRGTLKCLSWSSPVAVKHSMHYAYRPLIVLIHVLYGTGLE